MFPNQIHNVANTIERVRNASHTMGANDSTLDDLIKAETLIRECWIFAQSVADGKHIDTDSASRLLTAILGFEARVTGTSAGLNMLEAYHRQR